ncbi:hypothetical protein TNCV_42511 [Trichonephila clavipes]|nr:hypothetical protein TNCV_42511 [Trichonephila clavipes]
MTRRVENREGSLGYPRFQGETHMNRARFELRTGVTINEETTPENKQKKSVGLSVKLSNIVKPVYTKQCDKQLL